MSVFVRNQRGGITVMTGALLFLALVCMVLVIDSGRLYLAKRSLQRIADVAAMEAVARSGTCSVSAPQGVTATPFALESALRNGYASDAFHTLVATCGNVIVVNAQREFEEDAEGRAIRVVLTHDVPASLVAGGLFAGRVVLQAQAIASRGVPLAALTLRTSTAALNTDQSPLLGALLGQNLSLSALAWDGLLNTRVDLNDLLFELQDLLNLPGDEINLTVLDTEKVLAADASLVNLVDATINVLQKGGGTGDVVVATTALQALRLTIGPTIVNLGELISVQGGTQSAGLTSQLNLFDLIQGSILLANSDSALAANLPVAVPGLGTINLMVKVTEPPQLSAVGNPELARQEEPNYLVDPNYVGPNRIYVRSAQLRLYAGVDLAPLVGGLNTLLSSTLLTQVTSLLNFTAGGGIISGILSILPCDSDTSFLTGFLLPDCQENRITQVQVLSGNRIDVALQLGQGEARVADYSCGSGNDKTLLAKAKTAVAGLRVGRLGTDTNMDGQISSAESAAAVMSNQVGLGLNSQLQRVPVVEFSYRRVRPTACLLLGICSGLQWFQQGVGFQANEANATRYVQNGIALKPISSDVSSRNGDLEYESPETRFLPNVDWSDLAEIDKPPEDNFKALPDEPSLVSAVGDALSSIQIEAYRTSETGVLLSLITDVLSYLTDIQNAVAALLSGALSSLLDPVVDLLLSQLGVNMARTEVAGFLTCSSGEGVTLVQ